MSYEIGALNPSTRTSATTSVMVTRPTITKVPLSATATKIQIRDVPISTKIAVKPPYIETNGGPSSLLVLGGIVLGIAVLAILIKKRRKKS